MPVGNAPILSDNQDLTTALLKVTMAWPDWQSTTPTLQDWHLVSASELGLSATQLSNGVFRNANAEAIVAAATYNGHRTLAVGFRGTNDTEDWRQDFQNVNEHYTLFEPLVTALKSVVANGEFDLVLATGHSLGGAMTQLFMADYNGIAPAYAITTGSPGILQDQATADARIINYQVADDPIVYLGANRALVGQTLSGPLGALLVGQLANVLNTSFGIPTSTFTESIPFFTRDYLNRGTVELLKAPGHPDTPPSSLLSLLTSYNASAHEFPAYQTGIAAGNRNPFDLTAGSRGGAGNDALFATTGNDAVDGGLGYDTLYLHIERGQAVITSGADGLTSVSSTASGNDSLISVERLAFADKRLAFDLGATQSAGMAARLIGAAFDAPAIAAHPDWMGAGIGVFDQGASLLDVCLQVVVLMGDPDNQSFVNTVYTNVAGVAPGAAELQHFTSLLEGSGGTLSKAALLEQAALIDVNETNIGLVGLQSTGVEFL
ncbi:MAG: hypothetical protein RLZZ385_1445 [Pseudomonadota bacterium]|jgi:pimeloyl-ACP methyl ester carboxylesterase